MELYWARYSGSGKPRHMLLLPLGRANGKLVCIDTDSIGEDDKKFLKSKAGYLDKLSMDEKIGVIRELRPHIMKSCKTISESNLIVDKTYPI